MRRLRFMTWVIVPATLYVAYALFGLPHFIWQYTWLDEGHGFDPLAPRHYVSCTFAGPYGQFRIDHPRDGKCAWIIFRKSSSRREG